MPVVASFIAAAAPFLAIAGIAAALLASRRRQPVWAGVGAIVGLVGLAVTVWNAFPHSIPLGG